ncbi:MAG: response regulator [Anaerolineae bacterium]|nr:response regulator [Anaerolineae bacterium]
MSKGRILVCEDDNDISNMLKIYFTGQGYDMEMTRRGEDALKTTQQQLPQLIILDINLPDMDGYTICKTLRTTTRTKHIPIIFLTQKDDRSDRIAGLELGADDYITKPFDIEELRLRIQNAIASAERMGLTDPRSGLPSGRLIEEQLREMLRRSEWAYGDIRLNAFEPFRDKYGFVSGDEVLRFTAMLISEIVDEHGGAEDFIGHAGNDNFVVISKPGQIEKIKEAMEKRFNEEVKSHYSFIDREQGGIKIDDGYGGEKMARLMTIAVGVISSKDREFTDIREVTEAAAEARRKAQQQANLAQQTGAAPTQKAVQTTAATPPPAPVPSPSSPDTAQPPEPVQPTGSTPATPQQPDPAQKTDTPKTVL